MKRLAAIVVLSAAAFTPQTRPDILALAKSSLAQIDGEVKVAGLRAPVQVVRDTWGVPHITAQSTEDLFFAQGYVMAQDRLWQMEMWRRSAEGRLAEIAGAGARNCREFLDAAMYWRAPTENLICGDVEDNISWRPGALSPARKGWNGRLPVPGTGAYEWQGFRKDLPSELNPERGFITTANHNINPPGYTPPLMFKNADTRFERITRLRQLLNGPPEKLTLDDHKRMQHDAYSLRAVADQHYFKGWTSADPRVERARVALAAWDGVYGRDSTTAALYDRWRTNANGRSSMPVNATPEQVEAKLLAALTLRDAELPRWGAVHTRAFRHPLLREFDLAPVERSGGAGTVEADGATYREILDVANWDRSLAINLPGQSGQPGSPYYSSLLKMWADNEYFPLAFSSSAVKAAAAHRLTLHP